MTLTTNYKKNEVCTSLMQTTSSPHFGFHEGILSRYDCKVKRYKDKNIDKKILMQNFD